MIKIDINHNEQFIRSLELINGSYKIGSHPDTDILLSYPTISKTHAILNVNNNEFYVEDAKSKNGTYLNFNNKRFRINEKSKINIDQSIYIGPFTLVLKNNVSESINLEALLSQFEVLINENKDTAKECFANQHLNNKQITNELIEVLINEIVYDGPITQLLNNIKCKEIIINHFNEIYIDIGNGLELTKLNFISNKSFENWVFRKVHELNKRLDLQHPIAEATLKNGARFHAVLPPISKNSISVSIRKFGSAPIQEQDAIKSKWMSTEQIQFCKMIIDKKLNCIISGGTSAGKTSLLNFLCQYFLPSERVITIEDTLELTPPCKNLIQLNSRIANSDGAGEITLRKLIQSSLRMRPDRIIVGECRGDEVIEMLQALNTGHPGSLTTIHANSNYDAIHRLELLCLLGASNLSIDAIRSWIFQSIDVFIHVTKDHVGNRKINQISLTKNGIKKSILKDNHKLINNGDLYDVQF